MKTIRSLPVVLLLSAALFAQQERAAVTSQAEGDSAMPVFSGSEPIGTASVVETLTVEQALVLAEKNNRTLKDRRADLRAVSGDEKIDRSRFLPHVHTDYSADGDGSKLTTDSIDHQWEITLKQRIVEFGAHTEKAWELDRTRRKALYAYENTLEQVFKDLRKAYFKLYFSRRQIRQQQYLLDRSIEKYRIMQERLENGMVKKGAVLGARLNILSERGLILDLQQREHDLREELRVALARDSMDVDFYLASASATLQWNKKACIEMAVKNSTEIADALAETHIAETRYKDRLWAYGPGSIRGSAEVGKNNRSGGLSLSNNHGGAHRAWSIEATGSQIASWSEGNWDNPAEDGLYFSGNFEISFPLFDGLAREGVTEKVRSRYEKARNNLISKTRTVERATRDAFYRLKLARQQLDIAQERVDIQKEYFAINETLHEMGRISDDDLDNFREKYFRAQDSFINQKLRVLELEEDLRGRIRVFK